MTPNAHHSILIHTNLVKVALSQVGDASVTDFGGGTDLIACNIVIGEEWRVRRIRRRGVQYNRTGNIIIVVDIRGLKMDYNTTSGKIYIEEFRMTNK